MHLGRDVDILVVDFHGEATSEKMAMGYHFDGCASLVVGTHTHSSCRLSCSGWRNSLSDRCRHAGLQLVIGMDKQAALGGLQVCQRTSFCAGIT